MHSISKNNELFSNKTKIIFSIKGTVEKSNNLKL